MLRGKLISELVDKILSLKASHPIRVGISGITASGKTTLANELAVELQTRKKNVIRTSIDHFHNPKCIRYRQGKESALGYYQDAHDYESFKQKLLIPLGPGGTFHYQTASLELATDQYVKPDMQVASKDMILIVDGTFLFKKQLCDLYDFKIFVDTDFELARQRGAKREEQAFGSYEKSEAMFIKRYHAASKIYIDEHKPQFRADVVINNNNLNDPNFS